MNFSLETDRLILRHLTDDDVDGIFELDSNPEVHRYLGEKPIKTRTEAVEIVNFIKNQYRQLGLGRWAVEHKQSGAFMGWSGLKHNVGKMESLNGKRDFFDIGYRLIPRYWGQGYATESALAVLEYGFHTLDIQTICGAALAKNTASNIILRKIGLQYINSFTFEGAQAYWYELKKDDYARTLP